MANTLVRRGGGGAVGGGAGVKVLSRLFSQMRNCQPERLEETEIECP